MILPITEHREEIIKAVKNHYITIVSAETGSGKSTQIPQYLADYYSQVVVTEPRIMAAKTLAKRVAEEMEATLGEEVGYITGYDKSFSPSSKILYCTDGLQLIRTIFGQNNKAENVLIIDEFHEQNLNMEILVAYCKLMKNRWNTKVVIMSATLDTERLSGFFGDDIAILQIPGNQYDVTVEERPESALIGTIQENINAGKNILVFVAGKKEIADVMEALSEEDATVLPLHGELDWEEQKKCFWKYPNPKVIVATNVAQTSITIPDIDVVVDTGKQKISMAENGIQGLFLKDISRSDILQRKGRAGRTKSGNYFLCSNTPIKERAEHSIPEMKRSILDRVVLQIAEIGLDAEELEFYNQPDKEAIKIAKRELKAIGALSNNEVTEIGHKMVKIPVSVQFARMIVEAEKYGVTEQVIKIASIIEMGGLLTKEGAYLDFTSERKSDLLAELDVFEILNKMDNIDFKNLGIKKKTFFRIKEHIQKLQEALRGIVEMTNYGDREAILKSCLCGLVSHIYVKKYDGFCDNDGTKLQLDKRSCLSFWEQIVVGIPKTIEFPDRYGMQRTLNLLTFASEIDAKTLCELAPEEITEESSLRYSRRVDAVEITINKSFAGVPVDTEISYDKNHPAYAELKAEFEKEQREYGSSSMYSANREEVILIDGKQFKVQYGYFRPPVVELDLETLFTTGEREVFLDSGENVYFCTPITGDRIEKNIVALRNAVEMKRIRTIRERRQKEYDSLRINTLDDVIENAGKFGEIELTNNNGGYGDEPILVYGSLLLKKNTVSAKLVDDEATARENTLEALQHLFMKKIEKQYSDNKFSHQTTGKKKKELTKSEMEVKLDFYSLVRELMLNLSIDNVTENLEFLEEYYQELMQ